MPVGFKAWLLFRYLVDFVLCNEVGCYFAFCVRALVSSGLPTESDVLWYWVPGILLCLVSLYVKHEATDALGDFGWC